MLTVFKLKDIAILSLRLEWYRIAGGLEVNEKFSATLSIKIQSHAPDFQKLLEEKLSRGNDLPSLMKPLEGAEPRAGLPNGIYTAKSVNR